jgi:recombination protein RecT
MSTGTPAVRGTKEFSQRLETLLPKIAGVIPRHMTPERMVKIVQAAYFKSPALRECTELSIINSVLEASELGLEPNGALKHAYLIPFRDKKRGIVECTLQVSYLGFLELARRSGEFASIEARLIRAGDEWSLDYTPEPVFHHRPSRLPAGPEGKPGDITHAYAYGKLVSGATVFEVMEAGEIEFIRNCSKQPDSPAWVNHYGEMAKKTVLKRFTKRQARSPELAKAHGIDDAEYAVHAIPAPDGPRLSRTDQLTQRLAARPAPAELDPPDDEACYADDEAEMASEA